jgi:ubiquitin carboxyl-terminal hydrolase 5/13
MYNLSKFSILIHFRDPKDIVRPKISMQTCLDAFGATESIDGFFSSAINGTCVANK